MIYEYVGYHGTDSRHVKSIVKNNFNPSQDDFEWLGYGVYFFVIGISDPVKNASRWANDEAFKGGELQYLKFSVLTAKTSCTKLLDATTMEGLQVFNTVRESIIAKHDEHFRRDRDNKCDNRVMWNLVAQIMNLEVIVHNLYIKNKKQRIGQIASNVPNTTVMCVKDPNLIDRNSIKVMFEREVVQ